MNKCKCTKKTLFFLKECLPENINQNLFNTVTLVGMEKRQEAQSEDMSDF